MLLKSLERKECSELLRRVGFGRLGCANNNQPYVVPIYFALESEQLFARDKVANGGATESWTTRPLY
jgi:nitroimidazol reductase NimA-like FMN-containing flavoprotein (pyridoxamine 5'-phosphate oxidase superfamily)